MTDLRPDLHHVLREATEHIGPPDLTGRALATAHRRRVRRASAGLLAAVVLLGGGAAWAVQDREPRAEVVKTPTPTRTADPSPSNRLDALLALPTPPPIPDTAVQPRWDPRTAGELPADDIGLPQSLDPPPDAPELTSIPAAVALVEGRHGVSLVDEEGGWWWLAFPERALDVPSYVRTSRLSTDGTRVVLLGRTALWSRDVRSTRWREVDYPDGFLALDVPPGRRMIPQVIPMVAEHLWLARDTWWFADLDTGSFEVRQGPRGAVAWGGGDVYVESSVDRDYAIRQLSWGPLGHPARSFRADSLSTLVSFVADTDSLAAVRGACVGSEEEAGLLALHLDDLSTRAYLPVRDPAGIYSCGSALQAVAWLGRDTVLVSVVQARGASAGRGSFVTWDVPTGELRRVGTLPGGVSYDLARVLLGD